MIDKKTVWNLKAPPEYYAAFREKLSASTSMANTIMSSRHVSISERYAKWEKLLFKAAISTIGKTTVKPGRPVRATQAMKKLREERKERKKMLEDEKCPIKKKEKLECYIEKQ